MHNLVKETTGIDFHELSKDLRFAKEVTIKTLGNLDNKEKSSIEACPSVGHVLNEVHMLLQSTSLNFRVICFYHLFQWGLIFFSGDFCVKKG